MGVRQERKAATARDIQIATLELVESLGLEATTVARIAERAGISERTFFRYYDSKEAAVIPGQRELIELLLNIRIEPGSGAAQIFQQFLESCRRHFEIEIKHHAFRQSSRLMLKDAKLRMIATRREQELVTALSDSLVQRELVDAMQALLISEMVAMAWRVSWQLFAHEELAGRSAGPDELFEKAVSNLMQIATQQST